MSNPVRETLNYAAAIVVIVILLIWAAEEADVFTAEWFSPIFDFIS